MARTLKIKVGPKQAKRILCNFNTSALSTRKIVEGVRKLYPEIESGWNEQSKAFEIQKMVLEAAEAQTIILSTREKLENIRNQEDALRIERETQLEKLVNKALDEAGIERLRSFGSSGLRELDGHIHPRYIRASSTN